MNKLRDCYNQLQKILGQDIEPYESVELVERYRRFWRPDKVRIILLAESHVFTTEADRGNSVSQIDRLPGYPTEYAKFVYCLAYGENNLKGNRQHSKRDGTPHFWKIFYSCNNHVTNKNDFNPILKSTKYEQRLNNKVELLLSLKEKGIWLVDSSIVALYKKSDTNDSNKPPSKIMLSAIRKSWEYYTADVIKEADPNYVICIGMGVEKALKDDLEKLFANRYKAIEQPNARLSSEDHMANFREYGNICSGI